MVKGFFPDSLLQGSRQPLSLIPQCGACGIYKECNSPKMPVSGKGKKNILIIAEAPGREEDEHGIQLVGESGTLLEATLGRLGIDMRRDCWLTNSLICRPPHNRTPTDAELGFCRPNLTMTLKELNPEIIIPLGSSAIKSLLMGIWKDDNIGGITRWAGFQIPCQKPNAWICPTIHPSFLLHDDKNLVAPLLFRKHLKAAIKKKGRPWSDSHPHFVDPYVNKIHGDKEAAHAINWIQHSEKAFAFDFETTTKKAWWKSSEIVCCSICNGERTIAFPWTTRTKYAMEKLLRSSIPKIGFNTKFEETYCLREFGVGVKNWAWDGQLVAHLLDNRPEVTSLEFQSFVNLGMSSTKTLKKYMKVEEGRTTNTLLSEVDLSQLLEYCGMDSLEEYHIAQIQRRRIGLARLH